MTDQDKISRLAHAAATDVPSSSPANPHPVIAGPPFAIRKTPLCSECHASSISMPSFPRVAFYQEARVLLGDRQTGRNHRRPQSRRRPPLVAAACCLLCSLGALFVTSPRGEESLVTALRTVIQDSNNADSMVSNATPGGLEP